VNETRSYRWLTAPAAVLWLLGVAAPLLLILRMSLYSQGDVSGPRQFETLFYQPGTWTLENFVRVFATPFYLNELAFTVGLAVVSTALTLALGYVVAYAVYRTSPAGKAVLLVLVTLPKFTNILVFVYGLKMIFGPSGFWPVVAGEVLMLLPYAVLTIAASLEAVPYALVEAARGLGASAAQAFWKITFPLSLPGTIAAATLAILWSLGAFLGPYLLGQPAQYTISVEVDRQMNHDLNWALAAALNVVLLGVMAICGYSLTAIRRRTA
jgi:spermidine/putrescine transport system permease protein